MVAAVTSHRDLTYEQLLTRLIEIRRALDELHRLNTAALGRKEPAYEGRGGGPFFFPSMPTL